VRQRFHQWVTAGWFSTVAVVLGHGSRFAGMMRSMAEPTEPRIGRKRTRTRLALISVAVGALLILTISTLLNWPVGGDEPGIGASVRRGASPAPASVAAAGPGTCLDWTAPDGHDAHPVPCDHAHLFEVTGKAALRTEFGRKAPFPDTEQWQQLKHQRCTQVSSQYLSSGLDPKGRFGVGAFTPSEQGWNSGDRILHCGLQQPGQSARLYRFTGSVASLDQSDVYPEGRCLGINGKAVADPIPDCSQPHSVEITGVVNLAEPFHDRFPSESDQDGFLATRCAELSARYAGSPIAAPTKGLIAYWDTLALDSWDAGSRRVNCKVSAPLPDGSGLAPVTGSIKGAVQVGHAPAPQDTGQREAGLPAADTR
jgi:hypothetical protein